MLQRKRTNKFIGNTYVPLLVTLLRRVRQSLNSKSSKYAALSFELVYTLAFIELYNRFLDKGWEELILLIILAPRKT